MTPGPPAIHGVLFDLDGTLIDHFETLFRCYEYALGQIGRAVPSREVVRRSVGGSMEVTMRKFLGEADAVAAAAHWREHLSATYLDDVTLMPGAMELLARLHARGLKLGVFTNKIGEHSRGICRHLGIDSFLTFVLGANDTPWRKPQRAFSSLALERLGVGAAHACLVGDSPYDLQAAQVVGMRATCVTTGTHGTEELRAAGATEIFPDLATLGAAVFGS